MGAHRTCARQPHGVGRDPDVGRSRVSLEQRERKSVADGARTKLPLGAGGVPSARRGRVRHGEGLAMSFLQFQRGRTLIEILVAITIGLMLTIGILSIFSAN